MKEVYSLYSIGDIVKIGFYEQDNDESNGKESISWRILDKEKDYLLVVSEYALDNQSYNSILSNQTWETCSLRKWLNNEFYDSAFTELDKKFILTTTVTAELNPDFSTYQGSSTQDNIFLLSANEANIYFNNDYDRQCKPTEFAYYLGAYKSNSGNCWWWLRTSGSIGAGSVVSRNAVGVNNNGIIYTDGYSVDGKTGAVRPALRISINN